MSFVIKAKITDHDGWGRGIDYQIGPFGSKEEAYTFMRESGKFFLVSDGKFGPVFGLTNAHYSQVYVSDLTAVLTDPKDFM